MQTVKIINPHRVRIAAVTLLMLASVIPAAAQTSVATPMAPPPPPFAGSLTPSFQVTGPAPVARKDAPAAAQPVAPAPAPRAASPSAVR
jgi:hypothetical protein